ncbi:S8 family serine peptidase [Denitratimonas sp. CY0512]|uniref:S8 family serine peptidase n=1 Tax=Denitratimonas sp. CY0512 TaxID=3131940 RepID=UPI0030A543F8
MQSSSRSFPARRPLALLTLGMCLVASHGHAAGAQAKADPASTAGRVMFAPVGKTFEHDGFIVYYRDDAEPGDASSAQARQVLGHLEDDLARAAGELGIFARAERRIATGGHVLAVDGAMLDAETANQFMLELAKNPDVVSVEPNLRMYSAALPNDPHLQYQWGLLGPAGGINVEPAWGLAGTNGVVIAVIDTGRTLHPDLDAKTLAGMDMISDPNNSRDGNGRDNDPTDQGDWNTAGQCGPDAPQRNSSWHGTHVAGIAAAITHNSEGIAGTAPGAWLQHVRVLGTCGGNLADIADGIVWASGGNVPGLPANASPARVLNMSIQGVSACGPTYQNAINSARSRGSVVIVAAGNHAIPSSESTPGNCQGVVTVAANGPAGTRAVYSNYGPANDVSAPGGDSSSSQLDGILSTINLGTTVPAAAGYDMMDGTSMATPYVAGVAALMLSRNINLTPDQIANLLRNTARPFPTYFGGGGGTGIVDAGAALAAVAGASITQYPVSLALLGAGQGNVTSAPARINCGSAGAACSARFNANSTATLTAVPAPGHSFAGWLGACTGTNPVCTLTMNRGHAAHAVFLPGGGGGNGIFCDGMEAQPQACP